MHKKLITFLMAALTALAMMAAPAAAHQNTAADRFIGPAGNPGAAVAHNGIQCAAINNPNLLPLALDCVAPNK